MIGWLQGRIVDKEHPGKLVLNVHGVGYDIDTSLQTFFQVEQAPGEIALHIHTVVRDDAILLYGFVTKDERALFRALIKVNGVGPKSAISILSSTTPNEFIQCINQGNTEFLTKLPGIGKKTAERLIVEMKDSLSKLAPSLGLPTARPAASPQAKDEAISALEALGYKAQEAQKVVNKIDDGRQSCEQLIRQALQLLAPV